MKTMEQWGIDLGESYNAGVTRFTYFMTSLIDFARRNDGKPMDLGVLHFQTCPCEANQHTLFSAIQSRLAFRCPILGSKREYP